MLKIGYSKATVQANIAQLMREGYPHRQAVVIAYNLGRKCYFTRHKSGALEAWLSFPGHGRLRQHYNADGGPIFPMRAKKNPVRELDIPEQEMDDIRKGVKKQLTGKGAAVRKAASLYTDFTGHNDPMLSKIAVKDMPKVALEVGQCDGLLYTTIRDNVTEKYIHKFKKTSRPLLAASPDGTQLLLLGGAFNFTDRGIVDK